jgi:hypothetical protein
MTNQIRIPNDQCPNSDFGLHRPGAGPVDLLGTAFAQGEGGCALQIDDAGHVSATARLGGNGAATGAAAQILRECMR